MEEQTEGEEVEEIEEEKRAEKRSDIVMPIWLFFVARPKSVIICSSRTIASHID